MSTKQQQEGSADDGLSFMHKFLNSQHTTQQWVSTVPLDAADDGASSAGGSHLTGDKTQEEDEKSEDLVWKETRAVRRTKLFALVAITLIGLGSALICYFLVRDTEEYEFELEFKAYAREVAQVSQDSLERSFQVVGGLSKSITNMAIRDNATFPFFTHPNFDVVGGDAKDISGVDVIIMAPLVNGAQFDEWSQYSTEHQGWVQQGLEYRGLGDANPGPIPTEIHPLDPVEHKPGEIQIPDMYMPVWQMAGAPVNASIVNRDLFSGNSFEHRAHDVAVTKRPILSDACDFGFLAEFDVVADPFSSFLIEPIFDGFDPDAAVAAFLIAVFPWNTYFDDILMPGVNGIYVVVDDSCGDTLTYVLNGPKSDYVGEGDLHPSEFSNIRYHSSFAANYEYHGPEHPGYNGTSFDELFDGTAQGHCKYTLDVYPSNQFEDGRTSRAVFYTICVVAIFLLILVVLVFYDCVVARRQNRLMATAKRTRAIVSDLFPKAIQDRMMKEKEDKEVLDKSRAVDKSAKDKSAKLEALALSDKEPSENAAAQSDEMMGNLIAQLYPETTVFFADIAGFTAWSSAREPAQVFLLLETLYHSFDECAGNRRVFKVGTIGDCYVAVAGLPQPLTDHAVAMARFSRDCLFKFNAIVKDLESSLGPETADLALRVGMHSGAVTAGVLRGDRARFDVFGDTMNTASRMESTSERNRIQLSEDTAQLLRLAGKEHWFKPREEKVVAKGKGEMQTFWLLLRAGGANRRGSVGGLNAEEPTVDTLTNEDSEKDVFQDRQHRLVDWVAKSLLTYLKEIEARRRSFSSDEADKPELASSLRTLELEEWGRPLDEVVDIIPPHPDEGETKGQKADPKTIDLGDAVEFQVHAYVSAVSQMYRNDNAYHNFEHSCHVALMVMQLLSRVEVASVRASFQVTNKNEQMVEILSDPLAKFTLVFAGLVGDVDHAGVGNDLLVEENSTLATMYNNKCILEQNSLDLAWQLLMQGSDDYADMRRAIYQTKAELKRFRQLLVNLIMATDLFDKDLNEQRNRRWERGFPSEANEDDSSTSSTGTPSTDTAETDKSQAMSLKKTVLLESIMQACDMAHCMQPFHVFLKWNERRFNEAFEAFVKKRTDTHPGSYWFTAEIGFFDSHAVPLAKKLKACGVFGASGGEYVANAERNRRAWAMQGSGKVRNMLKDAVERKKLEGEKRIQDAIDRSRHKSSEASGDDRPPIEESV